MSDQTPVHLVTAEQFHAGFSGITKREYFAAMAMQGFLASPSYSMAKIETITRYAKQYADALLEALEKNDESEVAG